MPLALRGSLHPDVEHAGRLTFYCAAQQGSSSSGSLSSDGFKGSSEYSKSQLEASSAQKETFFARKMQVQQHIILYTAPSDDCEHLKPCIVGEFKQLPRAWCSSILSCGPCLISAK